VIVLADLLLLAAGYGVLRLARARVGGVAGLAFAWLCGVAALAVVTTLLGVVGLATTPPWVAPPLVALALTARPDWDVRGDRTLVPAVLALAIGTRLAFAASHSASVVNDEYAIWSLRGRALSLAGRLDPGLFANAAALYQHQDYPLLIPGLVAWTDRWGGGDAAWHVQVALMTAALLVVVGWGVTRLANPIAGIVAVLACVVPNAVGTHTMRVYADLPTCAFAVALVLLLLLWMRDGTGWTLRLGMVMSAGAVLTKNEGALFVAFACVLAAALVRQWRPLLPLAAGVAAYLPWFVWARLHDIGNDVVNADAGARAALSLDRLNQIADGMRDSWPLPYWWLLLLAAAVWLGDKKVAALLLGTTLASVGVLGLIYVVTPLEVTSHIASSAPRVLMFPALLTAIATPLLLAQTPDTPPDAG
jgi:hypothetical protein